MSRTSAQAQHLQEWKIDHLPVKDPYIEELDKLERVMDRIGYTLMAAAVLSFAAVVIVQLGKWWGW